MKKGLIITVCLILTIIVAVAIAWTPLRLDRFGLVPIEIDWIDVVKMNDITYQTSHPRQEVPVTEIGEEIGDIYFSVSEQVSNPHYRIKNGDATFLPVGTKLYSIRSDGNSVAVLLDGKYFLYTANE